MCRVLGSIEHYRETGKARHVFGQKSAPEGMRTHKKYRALMGDVREGRIKNVSLSLLFATGLRELDGVSYLVGNLRFLRMPR